MDIHAVGSAPEGELAQRDQVPLAEEMLDGLLGILWDIDLPLLESLQELVGREVNQRDLVRLVEDRVGNLVPWLFFFQSERR